MLIKHEKSSIPKLVGGMLGSFIPRLGPVARSRSSLPGGGEGPRGGDQKTLAVRSRTGARGEGVVP